MNPITNMKNLNKMNERELEMGLAGTKQSWHYEYRDSAWVFIGGLPYELTEGDVICVFSQYGEIVHVNLVRDLKTGKSKGFAFVCYQDQRSTILAVDNLNGMKLLGRLVRVDHVHTYKLPKDLEKMDDDRKKLFIEGCAPKPIQVHEPSPSSESSDSSEEERRRKSAKKKKKKEKKSKKKKSKHKKRHSSDSEDDDRAKTDQRARPFQPGVKTEPKSPVSSSRRDRDRRDRSRSPREKHQIHVKEEPRSPLAQDRKGFGKGVGSPKDRSKNRLDDMDLRVREEHVKKESQSSQNGRENRRDRSIERAGRDRERDDERDRDRKHRYRDHDRRKRSRSRSQEHSSRR